MNEKGAILPSIIVFVFLLVVILLSSVKIYHDQVHQLTATKESYKARTMLELAEQEMSTRVGAEELVETGTADFDVGKVYVKKLSLNRYQLRAVTNTQFSIQKEVTYTIPESEVEESSPSESTESSNSKEASISE